MTIDERRGTAPVVDRDCLFCRIAAGAHQADVVYSDEEILVFRDIRPVAPVHLLVIPRKHIRSINDLAEEDRGIVSSMVFRARDVAAEMGLARSGYRLGFNVERGAGQVIFHLHLHIIGGWTEGRRR